VSAQVDIAANLAGVKARIETAARRAGRDPGEITLVAVTKTHPVEVIQAAYQAGIRHFGENRVEEGREKIPVFDAWRARQADESDPPTWHMVGHLQRRKAANALTHFHILHSVDSLRLAERLARLAGQDEAHQTSEYHLPMPILLECNVSGEASKYGFELSRWQQDREVRAEFFDTAKRIIGLPSLRLQGLMTMAPIVPEAEQARPVFVALRGLRDALAEEFPSVDWCHLSMGMTDDFEVAIEEGATMVRVGRAIFGPRACEVDI
jgi:pyridoxal phosphate enzyme (YggS family)